MKRKDVARIQNLFYVLVLVILVLSVLGLGELAGWVTTQFVTYAILPAVLSLVVGSWLEQFTGDRLKRILFIVEIDRSRKGQWRIKIDTKSRRKTSLYRSSRRNIRFSVTVFAIMVLVLKFLIFR